MDSIKEFFKHINYRLSSPLIFSFIISWLVCNWKVTIGLVFHEHEMLTYNSYVDLISHTVNWSNGFCCPLFFAVVYTFGNPIITVGIHAFQTYFQKLDDDLNLKILKDSKIGIDKYISLKKGLDERKQILEKAINSESEMSSKLEEQRNETYKLQAELTEIKKYKNSFYIFNKASDKVIEVPNSASQVGNIIHLSNYNGEEGQIWEIKSRYSPAACCGVAVIERGRLFC